jgi:hypothetical protein
MDDPRKELNLQDIRYGLIALDSTQEGEKEILHFCGYEHPPTQVDADSLLEELVTDPQFELTERAESLIILSAPDWLVAEYLQALSEVMPTTPKI